MLLVLGAALGGFIRFACEYKFPPVGRQAFPVATFAVNVVGAFVLGLTIHASSLSHVALGVGFCGSLTTFSGVSLQIARRIHAKDFQQSIQYLLLLVLVGFASAWAGLQLGQSFM